MNKYTREDYQKFINMLQKTSFIRKRLEQYLKGEKLFVKLKLTGTRYKFTVYNSFQKYIFDKCYTLYYIMYLLNLEDLPLYINKYEFNLYRIAIKWRFMIGK